MAQVAEMSPSLRRGRDTAEAKYLYCIIKCDRERGFQGAPAIGVRGDDVHTVVSGGLAAVVSDSPDMRYDTTRANMVAHQTVIEGVMNEGFTVLPIRFGTVTRAGSARPVEDIRHKLLDRKSDELGDLYRQMDGRVELGVRALWRDEKAIYDEIVADNPPIRRLRDSLLPQMRRSPEATHFDRMRLGEMVKAALDRKREKEAKNLLARVAPLAERVRENKIVMDRMVMNAAFLVRKDNEAAFDEAVAALSEELGERMALRYIGPAPPFNFCEIVVTWDEE
ncbi:MAG: GvpL/GvpF family gas vesicle protein [Chloroflexi bacterium]|nr:GvpL/GvpF family gas vesicle protein [Chloroflexota bacterium]